MSRRPTLAHHVGIHMIGDTIGQGSTFSEALAKHPKIFDKLFINMVKAGEIGGVLEVALNRLAEFAEKSQSIKGKVKSAMFYPVAVMVVATIIMWVLMTFVIPKFEVIFADMFGDVMRKHISFESISDHFVFANQ